MKILDSASRELRERRLAGSGRAGSWARGRARREQRAYLRRTWKPYATFLTACYLVAALVCVWLPNDLTRGFVLGAAGVGAPALLWGLVVQMSGTAPTMMGDTAEQWTAGELKRLRSSGWRLVNHFALGRDDIDHLLVGPGGAYCVETKWSASPWTDQIGRDRVRRAVEQVSTNTRRLSNWQPFRRAGLRAQPLVVLWGGALAADDGLPAVRSVGSATVVAGHALRRWMEDLPTTGVSPEQVAAVWPDVDRQVVARDRHETEMTPMPRSAWDVVLIAIVTFTSGLLPFLVLGALLRRTGSLAWSIVGTVITAAIAAPLTRFNWTRWAAWGWLAGCVAALVTPGVFVALNTTW